LASRSDGRFSVVEAAAAAAALVFGLCEHELMNRCTIQLDEILRKHVS